LLGAQRLVLVRNAVMTVLMVDVSALNDDRRQAAAVETGTKLPPQIADKIESSYRLQA
jgi:hypothetical protein